MSRKRAGRWAVCVLIASLWLCACGDPWMDPERMANVTEVVVIPVPRGPQVPSAFRPAVVVAIARAAQPDAIFLEAPPDAFGSIKAAGAEHPWIAAMPDVGELLGLSAELRVSAEPISGWTPPVGRDWRAFIANGLPDDVFYRRARAHRVRLDDLEGDELEWVLGMTRRRLVEWEARALESVDPGALGTAAHSRVGAAHEAVFVEALERHRGQRIVVAIDAKHASRIERAVSREGNVRIVSPLAFEDALDELEELED